MPEDIVPTPPVPPNVDPTKVEPITSEEFMKMQTENKKLKDILAERENELKIQKEAALSKSKNYEELAKVRETERDDYAKKYNGLQKSLEQNAKFSKIKECAIKHGIIPEALADIELLDFPNVVVLDQGNGKFLISGEELAINGLKTTRPYWFTKTPAAVNSNIPNVIQPENGNVTEEQIEALEKKWRETRSSVDEKALQLAIYKFKTQN